MKRNDLILEGKALEGISVKEELRSRYNLWCGKVKLYLEEAGFTEEVQREVKVNMHYTENEYSEIETVRSLKKSLRAVQQILEEKSVRSGEERKRQPELLLIERILRNFYMYFRAMYKEPVHKSGTLKTEILREIQIGNEYDLQRMLYSILLPVFPTLRKEVYSDNGYGGMRADLYLDVCNLVIELKCTRKSMSEKQLTEELGADGFHYRADTVYFFICDKAGIITNPEAFRKAFERDPEKDGKTVKMFVLQTREF